MSEPGNELGNEPLNVGEPGRPEGATPGGQTQGRVDAGARGTASGGEMAIDEEGDSEREPEEPGAA